MLSAMTVDQIDWIQYSHQIQQSQQRHIYRTAPIFTPDQKRFFGVLLWEAILLLPFSFSHNLTYTFKKKNCCRIEQFNADTEEPFR